jgi:type IV secretory pathway VirB4 component
MKAAIVIDSWKRSIFEYCLQTSGYTYELRPGATDDTLTLIVETTNVESLVTVLRSANLQSRFELEERNAKNNLN